MLLKMHATEEESLSRLEREYECRITAWPWEHSDEGKAMKRRIWALRASVEKLERRMNAVAS